jgi:polysaccharide biosynthesis/export protein
MRWCRFGILWAVLTMVRLGFAQVPATPELSPSGGGSTKIPVAGPASETLAAEAQASSAAPATVPLEEPLDPDKYICGPGDVYELNFWGQQNLRLRIAADLEGRAFISKVGFVDVAGKKLTDVRAQVKKKVARVYPRLNVDLVLISPRSFLVHVVGYVSQPGTYPATPLDRISTLVTRAGGIAGSRRRIVVKHRNGTQQIADLLQYELSGNTNYDPFLLDGDVIDVPYAETQVTIVGAVRKPGKYELVGSKNLEELLQLAGGFTTEAARTLPLRLVRNNAQHHPAARDVPFPAASVPQLPLADGDIVYVRAVEELQQSVFLIGAVVAGEAVDAASTTKRLPYIAGDTVRTVIERAGGINASGDLQHAYIQRPREKQKPDLIQVDLEALLIRRDSRADIKVQANDTLVIPHRQYGIQVEGAVARPALYPYNPFFGVSEYIARAGGRTRLSRDISEVKLIGQDGVTRSYRDDMKLLPGDSILVPERNWSRAEIVQLTFAGASLLLSAIAVGYAVSR